MKFRNVLSAAAIALLSVGANGATLVIPAAGTGTGANSSQWQSEVTLHNAAPRVATLSATFHQGVTVLGPVAIELQPRQTRSLSDIAHTSFGLESGSGAVVLEVADRAARSIAVTSRTFNTSPDGEFGQDIPAIDVANAVGPGGLAALPGPSSAADHRFNFGVYAVDALAVTWEVLRADGSIAATKEASYAAGQHAQYGSGVETLLSLTPADNDTVRARVRSGKGVFYGSLINASGDPTFVPGTRTSDDIIIRFAGLDLGEDGSVDLVDANGDGVLDQPLVVVTSMYAAYLRLVASGEFGETVKYEIVSSSATNADLLDEVGTLRIMATGDLKNKNGQIVVKVIVEGASSLVTIPVHFR